MKQLWKGNHAVAEAAIRAGAQFFAGYPITPSTEILEHFALRLPQEGRAFVQAENEIAAIHMVGGAYCSGKRALTASCAGGFSLMQEFTAYASDAELPFVIINVVRAGRGIGSLESGQCGYRQSVYGGGNGDYRQIVYIPDSVQEMVDDMYEAFDMAERYRMGVIILTEASLGQMMEGVEIPPYKDPPPKPEWAIDGTKMWDRKADGYALKKASWTEKLRKLDQQEQRWQSMGLEDADYVFIACGLPSRSCREAVKTLRADGEKVGLIRPQLVFPFPVNAFRQVNPNVKGFICLETNDFGQMVSDVAVTVKHVFEKNVPVHFYGYGMGIPAEKEILDFFRKVEGGESGEVF